MNPMLNLPSFAPGAERTHTYVYIQRILLVGQGGGERRCDVIDTRQTGTSCGASQVWVPGRCR